MSELKRRFGGPQENAGRKSLGDQKKRRVQLYINPDLAAFLGAQDQPVGIERNRMSKRR